MSDYPDPDTWAQLEADATRPDNIEDYDEDTEEQTHTDTPIR